MSENDFVFILGYPGRTFRNRPAQFMQYQQDYLLPYVSNLYDFQNKAMEEAGKKDKATEIKLATRIKRNANVLKNYRGKLKGLNGLDLVQQKRLEDAELASYINSDVELKEKYGSLMGDIDKLYKLIYNDANREMWFAQVYSSTSLLSIARQINAFKTSMVSRPLNQRAAFYTDSIGILNQRLKNIYNSFDIDADRAILTRMLNDAAKDRRSR